MEQISFTKLFDESDRFNESHVLFINVLEDASDPGGGMTRCFDIAESIAWTVILRVVLRMVGNPLLCSLNLEINVLENCWLIGKFLLQRGERIEERLHMPICSLIRVTVVLPRLSDLRKLWQQLCVNSLAEFGKFNRSEDTLKLMAFKCIKVLTIYSV